MSLVNDALKRATEKHKSQTPVRIGLQLRPVEEEKQRRWSLGLVIPVTLVTIILAALVSLRSMKHETQTTPGPATASPEPATIPKSNLPIVSLSPLVVMARELPAPAVTNIQTDPPPVKIVAAPEPLRLQAVFYSPPRPSAIISGKTVVVGDSIRGLQVVAIGSSSALLIGSGQTNFLTLE